MRSVNVSRRWNISLMSPARDVFSAPLVEHRYAILSVPRSGSTLLSRAFEQTGLLGVPHEYLNPNAIAAWVALGGDASMSLEDYLQEVESRRTSINGSFGIKVHFRQFRQHFGEYAFAKAIAFVNAQDQCVLVTRRNHIAQAVSYYRARRTGLWTSEHEDLAGLANAPRVPFDSASLMECLNEVEEGERNWRRVISATKTPCMEVAYEDLIADYRGVMRELFAFLRVRTEPSTHMPTTKTQSHREDDLIAEFSRYLARPHPNEGHSH